MGRLLERFVVPVEPPRLEAGGGVVEAYPEQTEQRPPQRGAYLHTGPEELYAQYGFTRVRKIAKWRWVMRIKI
jgi:hypothetical protein